MKKSFYLGAALLVAASLSFTACGGSDSKTTETAETTETTDSLGSTSSEETTSVEAENATEESSSEDWDAVLDEFESYVDDYAKVVKKATKGDVSAIADLASMLESAQELEKKLDNAKSDLSAAQVSRLAKISQKMAKAAADAAGAASSTAANAEQAAKDAESALKALGM